MPLVSLHSPLWVKGGCGRQAVRQPVYPQFRKYPCVLSTYVSCHEETHALQTRCSITSSAVDSSDPV
jgi:hypothetical protein